MRRLRRYGLPALVSLCLFCRPAFADDTADRLRMSANNARLGQWDAAAESLPNTESLAREHLPLLVPLSKALSLHRPVEAAHLLAAMRRLDPETVRHRTALEALWSANPCMDGLWLSDLEQFPVDSETSEVSGATLVTLTVKPFVRLQPNRNALFPFRCAAYKLESGRLRLKSIVEYPDNSLERRARQTGRYLTALASLTDEMLGSANRARLPMTVRLETGGSPGARQWNGAISVQAASYARTDLEWIRQLTHEWGHACLPGIGGFREPETWSNGDLGERLFIPAMARAGRLDAWSRGVDAAPYINRNVTPLIASFAGTGPVKALLSDRGRKGYDHLLGACLYIREAYGAQALIEALEEAGEGDSAHFFGAFQASLARRAHWQVEHWGAGGPRPICIPRTGRHIVEGRNVQRNGAAIDGSAVFKAGWSMLQWEGTLTLIPPGSQQGKR